MLRQQLPASLFYRVSCVGVVVAVLALAVEYSLVVGLAVEEHSSAEGHNQVGEYNPAEGRNQVEGHSQVEVLLECKLVAVQ